MKMRDLINTVAEGLRTRLVETERSDDPDVLHRIVELLLDFVTRAPITDDLMDEVMHALPRPAHGMKLWRVIVLTRAQARQLPKGVSYPTYRYLSWTKDESALDRLAFARSRGGIPAIVAMDIPANQICVDVQAFVDHLMELERENPSLDFDTADLVSYADEGEVIVHHTAPLALTPQNTHLFRPQGTERPQVGDKVYRPHTLADDTSPIEQVLGRNPNGSWRIVWYGGEDDVRYVAPGEWEVIDYYG